VPTSPRRIDPKTVFTDAEWARLTHPSRAMGGLLILHAWGLIAASIAVFAIWPNPLTWLLAVVVVGARQLGLAILMHEGAHGNLSRNQALNDWLGQWLCAAPVGADLASYRPYHLKHHRHTQGPEDPDLVLSAPFPVSRESLWRKFTRDLTGQTFLKQRLGPVIALIKGGRRAPNRDGKSPEVVSSQRAVGRFLLVNAALLGVFWLAGQTLAFFTIWIVAMATWFPFVTRLRNIGEHAVVGPFDDPWRNARTVLANPIERLLVAPYWVHHHVEHHLWMYVPCWRLGLAYRMLEAKGLTGQMETSRGYAGVLRAATKPA
jgi:fatty acid desaturase